ncbi:hypothetical protein B0H13DRAFT_2329976 [Mycena leptocephala]|nr:hypothetical protein B0H13DRAFT_2329976 [Mycena leptocephala]
MLVPNRIKTEVQLYKEELAKEVFHQSTISLAFESPSLNNLTFSLSSTLITTKCSPLLLPFSPSSPPVLRCSAQPAFDRATCEIKTCVVALQPSFPTACNPAALQLGANTPLNTACLVAAAKGTAAFATHRIYKRRGWERSGRQRKARHRRCPAGNNNGQAVGPRATCDIKACVIVLQPSFPLCAPAVKQLGADNSFNTACLAAAAKGPAAFPSACDGCAAQFGVTDPAPSAQAAGVAIN